MRDAEAGQEGEPGREQPGKISPQLEDECHSWEGQGCGQSQFMVWPSMESRRQDQVKQVGSNKGAGKDCVLGAYLQPHPGLDFRGQRQGLGEQGGWS